MPDRPHPDVVVLLSGGLDSIVLAQHALNAGRLRAVVHYIYPQPAQSQERRAVMDASRHWHLAGHFIERRDVSMGLHSYGEMAIGVGQEGPRIVPGRNLAMLSHAVNLAAGLGAAEVWIGCSAEDQAEYPDCRPDFIETVHNLSRAWGIAVRAPFIDKDRAWIVAEGKRNGAPIESSWSCYQPTTTGRPCWSCDSCMQSIRAARGER